ncbi:MAG: hypothetical protein HXM18_04235 [Gemella morbillorum]|uniref:Lipoprotein n=1 Tax=Gemella morbillorum TaxID=29391 RepID=A0AAP9HCS2_9BACL|nr:hypothetical protein [Gemella morbillorum]EFV34958.1 hypothetical protein HMPREF0432_01405 [Gemella morbillorum M424]MBF1209725.1 hypothetical protein [Gemella morbillorum]QGS08989.1 hypothetical protein FOC49_03450 [Gemella morbillorum]
MNKKLLMVLAAGALVITGCAAKEANKEKNEKNNSEQKDVPKEEKKQEQKAAHDLKEAEKLINKVAISGNDLSRLKEQTNLLAWITQDRVKKSKSPNGDELFTISKEDYLDVINEYSDKTYTMNEALGLLKGPNFNEYEVEAAKSPLYPTKNEIHYYKGDDKIVFVGMPLTNKYPQEVEAKEKWKVEGDSIKINVLDAMTKTNISTITIKLNNKDYQGGSKKSKYYVESVKYN